jgi:hypothetical protein
VDEYIVTLRGSDEFAIANRGNNLREMQALMNMQDTVDAKQKEFEEQYQQMRAN